MKRMFLTRNEEDKVKFLTSEQMAPTTEEWLKAITELVKEFGNTAIHYVDCSRFIKEGNDDCRAIPLDEWDEESQSRKTIGLQLQHQWVDKESQQWFSYTGGEYIF